MLTLDGHKLHLFQFCRRKYQLESTFRYLPWSPHTLLTATLRQAILSLSNSAPLQQTISLAVNQFTANCKTPGLDVPQGIDTYSLAMNYVFCIRAILTYLNTTKLEPLTVKPPVQISDDLTWAFLSVESNSGLLHRFEFPDYINDNTRAKSGHSWQLCGVSSGRFNIGVDRGLIYRRKMAIG